MKHYCNYCDPKYFVIYGFCRNCKRRCEPPIFDRHKDNILDYDEMRKKWNMERANLILDERKRQDR